MITVPAWHASAACSGHPHAEWWDGRIDGEAPEQRRRRHQAAAVVCRTCPVTAQCWADRQGNSVHAGRWGGKAILRDEKDDVTPILPMPVAPTGPDTLPVLLTLRQRDVLACLAHGLSTTDTCTRLGISEWTMRTHMKAVLKALGARDRAHAVQLVWSGQVTVHTGRAA